MKTKTLVIGAGLSGLSAAAVLAKNGVDVQVFEKNREIGGRARQFKQNGYVFDIGPSWYWMPDVIEKFFSYFDKKPSDYYQLIKLDPSYRIYFGNDESLDVPGNLNELVRLFDHIEPGSGIKLTNFLKDAEYKYHFGMHEAVYKPAHSFTEFIDRKILLYALKLDFLRSVSGVVRKNFKDKRLIQLLEFPVLFLGATPQNTPSLYSLMNYADLVLGSWYPMGGMFKLIDALYQLAGSYGVTFHTNAPVSEIIIKNKKACGLKVFDSIYTSDFVIGSADYHHIDNSLLPEAYRNYSEKYWHSRVMAPSALLIFLGVRKKLKGLLHHNIFFDTDFDQHAEDIYSKPKWPEEPALYVSCTSKTDPGVAPPGCENLVILIPIAPGLEDNDTIKEHYFRLAVKRFETITGQSIIDDIDFKRIYSCSDFTRDYNSFKGNAYGLANILWQTAFLKPKMKNRKVQNLFYSGQLTTPGPGIPPSIISGQVAALEILKKKNQKK
ncbi:MAG: phytoene desaturase [Bacteroidales bacterium]|nr:phytoene desaturase [Bacteroidales bacterium]